jgi:hypothetical protein
MTPIQSESAAWRYVATLLQEQGMPSFSYRALTTRSKCKGLCAVLTTLAEVGKIAWSVKGKMSDRVWTEVRAMNKENGADYCWNPKWQDYLFPPGKAEPRVILAQFFACAALDEEKAAKAEMLRIAKLDDAPQVTLGAEEFSDEDVAEIERIATEMDKEEDGYIARANAISEGAEQEEIEGGAGSESYDLNLQESNAAPW